MREVLGILRRRTKVPEHVHRERADIFRRRPGGQRDGATNESCVHSLSSTSLREIRDAKRSCSSFTGRSHRAIVTLSLANSRGPLPRGMVTVMVSEAAPFSVMLTPGLDVAVSGPM